MANHEPGAAGQLGTSTGMGEDEMGGPGTSDEA